LYTKCVAPTKTLDYGEGKGHNWVDSTEAKGTSPTCTEPGYQPQECSRCGTPGEDRIIPANGHSDILDDGTCSVCGKYVSTTEIGYRRKEDEFDD